MKKSFGDRLAGLRGMRNRHEFAKEIGIPYTTYCRYEDAKRSPDWDSILKICKYCGVSADRLLGLEMDNNLSLELTQKGFVAFLDILGYQQIGATTAYIKDVSKSFEESQKAAKTFLKETNFGIGEIYNLNRESTATDFFKAIIDNIEITHISDSLIISTHLSAIPLKQVSATHWPSTPSQLKTIGTAQSNDERIVALVFIEFVRKLYHFLFRCGLPTRGVVDKGVFAKEKNLFAGKPIMNAHSLEGLLCFSGAVLTPKMESWMKHDYNPFFNQQNLDRILPSIDAPTKEGTIKLRYINGIESSYPDLREYVFQCFSKYGMSLKADVLIKLENTIAILEHLKPSKSSASPAAKEIDWHEIATERKEEINRLQGEVNRLQGEVNRLGSIPKPPSSASAPTGGEHAIKTA